MTNLEYDLLSRGFDTDELYQWVNDDLDLEDLTTDDIATIIERTSCDVINEVTVSWMESMKQTGGFDGFPEEDMDYKSLDDGELDYYFQNWILSSKLDY